MKHKTNIADLFPNKTLEADADVILELWKTIQDIPADSRPTYSHIKGHQDKNKEYHELELPAQLNIDADEIAGQFLINHPGRDYSTATLLPTTGAQLHLPEGTVNSKLKRELRLARTAGPLMKKLCNKNKWSEETFQSIDWEAHRLALNRLKQHQVTLVKHLHNFTPVGKLVHTMDPKYPPHCPSCPEPLETRDHLPLCPARDGWRKDCYKEVKDKLEEWDTHPELMELLLQGLQVVLYGKAPASITVSQTVQHVLAAQSLIGWNHLLKGRLSSLWKSKQHAYLKDNNKVTSKVTGQTWATNVVTLLLQQWLNLWSLRNGDRHGRDFQTRSLAQKLQARYEIHQLYQIQDQIPEDHQFIFRHPLETCLQWNTSMMVAWINSYKPVLELLLKPPPETTSNDTNGNDPPD